MNNNNNDKAPVLVTRSYSLCPTITMLMLSIIFMILGFVNGEIESYFQKAVLVCTQCIGLG